MFADNCTRLTWERLTRLPGYFGTGMRPRSGWLQSSSPIRFPVQRRRSGQTTQVIDCQRSPGPIMAAEGARRVNFTEGEIAGPDWKQNQRGKTDAGDYR
jgi:hypothetical protein